MTLWKNVNFKSCIYLEISVNFGTVFDVNIIFHVNNELLNINFLVPVRLLHLDNRFMQVNKI